MDIKPPITIGHLREIAEKIDNKLFRNKRRVEKATNSVIGESFLFWRKIFSMTRKNPSPERKVEIAGNVQPKDLLEFGNGFQLKEANIASFGECLKIHGAKFIVDQLTKDEISGLIKSEYLSIPQKSQICEACKGGQKEELNGLLSQQLEEKLLSFEAFCHLEQEKVTLIKQQFDQALKNPEEFSNYMLDIFANTSSKNLPGALDSVYTS